MRTGFYFQMARGRAIARTNAMKEARRIKARLKRHAIDYDPKYPELTLQGRIDVMRYRVELCVRRARQANRDHRRYRKTHLEIEREDQ